MDKQKLLLIASVLVFACLCLINLITVFTPEIGFDALWYHLTLPKLWIFKREWFFSGGLLYYSAMPRLTETIFIPLIALSGFVGPKLVQFAAGLGTTYITFKIARLLKMNRLHSILSAFAFYITWLVSWQSGSAYIDLVRAFIENLALLFFLLDKKIYGAVCLGLAIGTKWLSLGSLLIYSLIFGVSAVAPALLIASPWFAISYFFTHNPIYPLFEPFMSHTLPSISNILFRILLVPVMATKPVDDFLTPLGGLFVLLSLFVAIKYTGRPKQVALVGILGAIFVSILNPPSSRFLLPYLPSLCVSSLYFVSTRPIIQRNIFYVLLLSSFVFILILRLIAVKKYIPYLLGRQTQNQFLASQKSKLPDTFIDSDEYVKNNLKGKKILIDRLHNLYYFPYDFDHTSWAKDTNYDYLVTTEENPETEGKTLIHTNEIGIQVFKFND